MQLTITHDHSLSPAPTIESPVRLQVSETDTEYVVTLAAGQSKGLWGTLSADAIRAEVRLATGLHLTIGKSGVDAYGKGWLSLRKGGRCVISEELYRAKGGWFMHSWFARGNREVT